MELATLKKFDDLTAQYQLHCKYSLLLIDSIAQLKKQMSNFKTQKLVEITGTKVAISEGESNEFGGFSDLNNLVIYQQQDELNSLYDKLRQTLADLSIVLNSMIDLEQFTIKKAFNAAKKDPFEISIIEVCRWLENQVFGYKMDYLQKYQSYYSNPSLIHSKRVEWELCEHIDYKEQVYIQERMKLVTTFSSC